MNEFGEPNMGNPSVRFDEGRERVGHWPDAPLNPSAPAYSTKQRGTGIRLRFLIRFPKLFSIRRGEPLVPPRSRM
jgi:hypothetical protein